MATIHPQWLSMSGRSLTPSPRSTHQAHLNRTNSPSHRFLCFLTTKSHPFTFLLIPPALPILTSFARCWVCCTNTLQLSTKHSRLCRLSRQWLFPGLYSTLLHFTAPHVQYKPKMCPRVRSCKEGTLTDTKLHSHQPSTPVAIKRNRTSSHQFGSVSARLRATRPVFSLHPCLTHLNAQSLPSTVPALLRSQPAANHSPRQPQPKT